MTDDPTASSSAPGSTSNGGGPHGPWTAPEPGVPPQVRAVEAIERAEVIDGPAGAAADLLHKLVPSGPVKDLLSGTWLGHPLHPLLTDVVIGSWTSALLVDLLVGEEGERAADRLIGVGMLAALPTAASGASDWSDTLGKERRVGAVHAVSNYTALGLYGASLLARKAGRRRLGVALSSVGAGVLGVGGYLGAHLTYARGVGVDETTHNDWPQEWMPALDEDEVPADGTPKLAEVAGIPVLVSRRAGRLAAIANTCTHRGGPLDEGEFEDGCVVCPWHGSKFSLADGSIVRGPATAPQPAFDVRVRDGCVELRAAAREIA